MPSHSARKLRSCGLIAALLASALCLPATPLAWAQVGFEDGPVLIPQANAIADGVEYDPAEDSETQDVAGVPGASLETKATQDAGSGVALGAKALRTGKKPVARASSAQGKMKKSGTFAARLAPLFQVPGKAEIRYLTDFVARDEGSLAETDLSAAGAAARNAQARNLENDYRQAKAGTPQARELGERLARLYEQQCLYLEHLRGFGLQDPAYPDLASAVPTARRYLADHLEALQRQYPKAPNLARWQALAILSRLRAQDSGAQAAAVKFARSGQSDGATRVLVFGIIQELASGKSQSKFGNAAELEGQPLDALSRAVLRTYQGEQALAAKNWDAAQRHFEQAARDSQPFRANRQRNPITLHAAERLVDLASRRGDAAADSGVAETLGALELHQHARAYLESLALQPAIKPEAAIARYNEILRTASLPQGAADAIAYRMLDIAILSGNGALAEQGWQGAIAEPEAVARRAAGPRVFGTQRLLWAACSKSPVPANLERFLRLHDAFMKNPGYAKDPNWTLHALDALVRLGRHGDAAQRADELAQRGDPGTKLAALRISARARETLLKLSPEPGFALRSSQGEETTANAYVRTLDALDGLVKGSEQERGAFQAAYVNSLGADAEGKKRMEETLRRFPRSKYSAQALSYLLDSARARNDDAGVERAARTGLALRIKASQGRWANLRGTIEASVYAQARALARNGQAEASAQRYLAFQREFPGSANAPQALSAAADNYLQIRKPNEGIRSMELLIRRYPTSPLTKETRWRAAEESRNANQNLRAALHYEAFAQTYKQEGKQRTAFLKAAEMHRSVNRYASTINALELHLKDRPPAAERERVEKQIAQIQAEFGQASDAVAAFERVIAVTKDQDEIIKALGGIARLQYANGQEDKLRLTVSRMGSSQASSAEALKSVAWGKFAVGKMDARDLRELEPMEDPRLADALTSMLLKYDRVKSQLLSPCEVPGHDHCALGAFETSKLAEELAKKIYDVEAVPSLAEDEASKIGRLKKSGGERLANEARAYAQQAEDSLGAGVPDRALIEQIKSHAQKHRGEGASLPQD